MPVRNRFAELLPEIAAWRQQLHANPELLFDTVETGAFVAEKLMEFGCDEVVTGLAQTGVVGVIRGKQSSSRTVALRADMDALPIEETTGVDYASKNPGKMHACGHDGHTAMLLGAAKYLAETRNFAGTVILMFQPAEEGGGGAKVMMDEGLIERFGIDEVYGMHNVPNMDEGTFAIRSGPFYGSADQFEIVVHGQGGHAAQPHTTIDATVIASHVIIALQSIASRLTDPVKPVVVSVTAVETDTTAHNVIAGQVRMVGTVRVFDPALQTFVEERLSRIATLTAEAHGGSAKVRYERGYPVLTNTPDETDFAADVARRVSGECADAPLYMWGEDFAYLLEERPGAYIHLGIGPNAPLHHPDYNFNDDVIPVGCSWFAEIVESRMKAA
jgi:hippurate hydrolase